MKFFASILFVFTGISGFGQIPDSIIFDWNISGNETFILPQKKINALSCGMMADSNFDNSEILQSLIDSSKSDTQTIIHFGSGRFVFSKTIRLKSNISIVGEGATNTHLVFNNTAGGHLFEISAIQNTNFLSLTDSLRCHSKIFKNVDTSIQNGLYELLVDGTGLATSDWAMKSIGQILLIDSIKHDTAFLNNELKLDYYKYQNLRIRPIHPIRNVHFKYFKLERLDQTVNQTNNFNFYFAAHSTISGVESNKSNMSHVTFNKSYRCRVADSYFHHAFDYGGGGKAYGVELSFTSSHCLIENNIFENLRHSILLQAGPSGNVISGNYSFNPFWKESILPSNSAGELVLHGNYPFANLFEGNEVGNIVVDNSHGFNGPGNLFYRNRASLWGIFMNNNAGNTTHFIGNEITGTLNTFTGSDNVVLYNYLSPDDTIDFQAVTLPKSLYTIENPSWWPRLKIFPLIGLPKSIPILSIPSKYRNLHDSMRALRSIPEVFKANIKSSFEKKNDQLITYLDSKLQVNVTSIILEKYNPKYKVWLPITPNLSNNTFFQHEIMADTFLLAKEISCYRWKAKGMLNQNWESDTFCMNNLPVSVTHENTAIVKIYPNPTETLLHLYLIHPSQVKIYSIIGEILYDATFETGSRTIDVNFLPKASYVVEVFDGWEFSRKMIQKL